MNVITRDFINPDFKLYSQERIADRDLVVDMIRYWKIFLWEKYNIRPGMKIGIAMLEVDVYHLSLLFAASELGLSLVVLDHPVSENTINKTKAAMFAPIDIGIVDHHLKNDQLHQIMMEKFCTNTIDSHTEFDEYQIQDHDLYSAIKDKFFCKPSSVLVLASTSGTTSESKAVPYTQKYLAELTVRNSKVFNYTKDSRVVHTRNMHHASSLLIHFLPTVYACSEHWAHYVNYQDSNHVNEFANLLVKNQINFAMLCNNYELNGLLDVLGQQNTKFKQPLDINISGFHLNEHYLEQVKKHNFNIVSTFGSVDTGVPVFVNRLEPTSSIVNNSGLIGYFPNDGFYDLTITNSTVHIGCSGYWMDRTLNDLIEERNGLYYHLQRDTVINLSSATFNLNDLTEYVKLVLNYNDIMIVVDQQFDCLYLVIWDQNLDITLSTFNQNMSNSKFTNCVFKKIQCLTKKDFVIDTKVSVDQLRGHLQNL